MVCAEKFMAVALSVSLPWDINFLMNLFLMNNTNKVVKILIVLMPPD